jgi:hypothetical protein
MLNELFRTKDKICNKTHWFVLYCHKKTGSRSPAKFIHVTKSIFSTISGRRETTSERD